jgi:hypothetical protein
MIRRLPQGCQYDIEQRGELAAWGLSDHLLRATANAVIAGNFQRAGKRPPPGAFIADPASARAQARNRAAKQAHDAPPKGINELNALFDRAEGRRDSSG